MNILHLKFEHFFNSALMEHIAVRLLPYRFSIILLVHLVLFAVSFTSSVFTLYEGLFTESVARALMFSLPAMVMKRIVIMKTNTKRILDGLSFTERPLSTFHESPGEERPRSR